MTRPKQAEHNRRALIILLLEEIQIIQRNAYIVGLSVSEYMRRCSLNNRLHSRINDAAINCVNSLCGLIKHLLTQIRTINTRTNSGMNSIRFLPQ